MDIFIHEIYESEQEYILHASENDVNGTTELANWNFHNQSFIAVVVLRFWNIF